MDSFHLLSNRTDEFALKRSRPRFQSHLHQCKSQEIPLNEWHYPNGVRRALLLEDSS